MSNTLFDLNSYTKRTSTSFTDYDLDVQDDDPLPLKDSGLAISFGKTLPQLYGGKSVTRRTWTSEYAKKFINAYWEMRRIKALDKDYRYGGKQIGWLRLTTKPYQESLSEMPIADVALEGFPELSKEEFIAQFFDNNPHEIVWVIRFEFAPFPQKICSNNGSTYAVELGQDSPTQELNCGEEAQTSSVNGMTTAEISSSNDSQNQKYLPTSENLNGLSQNLTEELTLLQPALHANHSQLKGNDSEPTTSETVSQQSLVQLNDLNPSLPSSKTSQDCSVVLGDQDLETERTSTTFSVIYPPAGTMQNGNVSAAPTLDRPGIEKDSLLLRSPGALSSTGKGRPPGQTKLESQLKKLGLIAPGEVVNPEFLEDGFNLPLGWTSPTETRTAMELAQLELPAETELTAIAAVPSETVSTGESQPLDSVELSTSVKPPTPNPQAWLTLSEIHRDGGTQPRAFLDLKHVAALVEVLEDGGELDPVTVFYDGSEYWLADGFHRCRATEDYGQEEINCTITQGTRRDAVLYSVGANAEHKAVKPRSREDKRRAVTMLLNDPEWQEWSNCKIAQVCKVSESLVRSLRLNEVRNDENAQTRTYTTKHGTTTKMRTGKIGQGETKQKSESVDNHSELPTPNSELPAPPPPVEDYLIGFVSNLDKMSIPLVEEAQRRIDQRLNRQSEVDELKAQVEAIASERDQFKVEVEAIAFERDELKAKVTQLLQEIQSLKSQPRRRRKT